MWISQDAIRNWDKFKLGLLNEQMETKFILRRLPKRKNLTNGKRNGYPLSFTAPTREKRSGNQRYL